MKVPACESRQRGLHMLSASHLMSLIGADSLLRVKSRYEGRPLTLDLAFSLGSNPRDLLQCQLPLGILREGEN